jgi:hypothetical protein
VTSEVEIKELFPFHDAVPERQGTGWPDVWSFQMWTSKKEDYPCLICRGGKLGCDVCSKVSISVHKPLKVSLSAAWAQCSISQYGSMREAQLTSLHKKVKEHKQSTAHSLAVKIAKEAESKTLEKVVDSMTKSEVDSTVKVMRTAYYIENNDRPYTDNPNLVELQTLNEVEMGIGRRSRFSAVNFIDLISTEMRKKLCSQIQDGD